MKDLRKKRKEYRVGVLQEEDWSSDPFSLFSNWYEDAEKNSKIDEANAMVLATVHSQARPSARIILLKAYSREGFLFFSNYNSKKGRELAENPRAALLFYWEKSERQIRIEGRVEVASKQVSDEYFYARPLGSQISGAISPQSAEITDMSVLKKQHQELLSNALADKAKIVRPDNWGGYILIPDYFEFWQGGESRLHDRFVFSLTQEKWQTTRIAP